LAKCLLPTVCHGRDHCEVVAEVFDDLHGDVQFAGDGVGVAVVFVLGEGLFARPYELGCGFHVGVPLDLRAQGSRTGFIGVLPVHEFVCQGAALLGADEGSARVLAHFGFCFLCALSVRFLYGVEGTGHIQSSGGWTSRRR
jgi:hypothetical protein